MKDKNNLLPFFLYLAMYAFAMFLLVLSFTGCILIQERCDDDGCDTRIMPLPPIPPFHYIIGEVDAGVDGGD